MEGDHAPRRNRNFFPGLRIAPGALWLVTELEVAESRELHAVAAFQRVADFLEKGFYHVFGLTFVEADFFKQQVCEFCLGQRHFGFSLSDAKLCRKIVLQAGDQLLHGDIDFRVLQSPLSILHNYAKSKTFFALFNPFSGINVEESDVLNERLIVVLV